MVKDIDQDVGRPGIGVDARGGGVIDPTKNVLDLVKAESRYQDETRGLLKELVLSKIDGLREVVNILSSNWVAYQNAQRDAETKRIDQLAQTRQEFQNTIRDMLAESVRTTSNLVSTQLVQIQATFDTRVTKLEAGAFTQAGKSSVADPALADAITRMTNGITSLRTSQDDAQAKLTLTLASLQANESRTGGRDMGRADTNARLLAVVMAMAAVASPIVSILVTIMVMRGGH